MSAENVFRNEPNILNIDLANMNNWLIREDISLNHVHFAIWAIIKRKHMLKLHYWNSDKLHGTWNKSVSMLLVQK